MTTVVVQHVQALQDRQLLNFALLAEVGEPEAWFATEDQQLVYREAVAEHETLHLRIEMSIRHRVTL